MLDDKVRKLWWDLVADCKKDTLCNTPSLNSKIIIEIAKHIDSLQYDLCNVTRALDMTMTKLKLAEDELNRLNQANDQL